MENRRTITLRSSRNVRQSIAYTEDNVAVYNLRIEKLPNNVQQTQIRRHFSKFGHIEDVHITYGKTRSTPAQCIIKYKNVEGACAALKQRNHYLNYQRITVKACPSWEQPSETDCGSMKDNYLSLLFLNDYCLEEIFKKLDLRQQIRLSLCHSRLEEIFMHFICPHLSRYLNLEQLWHYSTWELRQFFYTAGLYIDSLIIGPRYSTYNTKISICTFIKECKLRIKRLHIISKYSWDYYDFLNAMQLNYITELELYMCNLFDFDIERLRNLRNLRALGLAYNQRIKGINLKLFRKLERLSLCGCESITEESLMYCCQHLQLKYLDIRLTDGIQHPEKCIEYCKTLDSLKLSGLNGDGAKNIVKLPRLKSLEVLHFNSAMASTFYSTLADYHADDLVELKLTGQTYIVFPSVATNIARLRNLRTLWLGDYEYNVSKKLIQKISNFSELEELSIHYSTRIRDRHLIPLIIKCTKLKRIDIRMCRYITQNFIWNTLNILQQRAADKNPSVSQKSKATSIEQPLAMLVYGTSIRRDILQSATYQRSQHLLKLLFHCDKPLMGLTNEGTPFDIRDSDINCNRSEDSDEDSDAFIDSDTDHEDEESTSDEERNVFFYIF